jgi:polyisoprenoid-binding protein YceI
MIQRTLALLVSAALFVGAPASAADWAVNTARSQVGFSGTQTGTPFKGRFDRFSASINFDPAHPEAARIVAVIDLATAKTGDPQRDSALPTADWLDAAHARTARFQTTSVRRTGPDTYLAQGQLTLRGQTRPVTLPFNLRVVGKTAHAVGHARLIRTAFGVGQGQWASGQWVALEVGVDIDITAQVR